MCQQPPGFIYLGALVVANSSYILLGNLTPHPRQRQLLRHRLQLLVHSTEEILPIAHQLVQFHLAICRKDELLLL